MRWGLYEHFGKRSLDVAIALMVLIVSSPLLVVLAILIRIRLGKPVIFRQTRHGFRGREFEMMKFRTMSDARDESGELLPDTVRLTTFGRFLRATSLDELPELLNVLQGTMSIVGPRPLLLRYTPYYTERERKRFCVRPGITGLAQVSGRNDLSWTDRLAKDVEYVDRLSLSLDLTILALTVHRVLARSGLQTDPGAVRLDFDVERRGAIESAHGTIAETNH